MTQRHAWDFELTGALAAHRPTLDWLPDHLAELLPDEIRAPGMGLAVVLFWLLSFALAQGLDPLLNALTPQGLFSALAASCALVVGFVVACVPETKGELPVPVSRSNSRF